MLEENMRFHDYYKIIDNLTSLGIYGFDFDRNYVSKLTNLTNVDLDSVENIKELDVLKEMKGLTYIYVSIRNTDDQKREKLREDLLKKHPNCTIYVY